MHGTVDFNVLDFELFTDNNLVGLGGADELEEGMSSFIEKSESQEPVSPLNDQSETAAYLTIPFSPTTNPPLSRRQ